MNKSLQQKGNKEGDEITEDDGIWRRIERLWRSPPQGLVYMGLLCVQLVFCGWVIFAKIAMSEPYAIRPIVFCFYRECLSALVMIAIALKIDGFVVPKRRDLPRFILLGFCTFFCIYGYLWALEYVSATDAALMSPLQPVLTVVFGAAAGIEHLTLQRNFGVASCALGSLTVTLFSGVEDKKDARDAMFGMMLLFGCATAAAVLFLAQKRVLQVYPSTTVTACYYSIAGCMTAFVASPEVYADPGSFLGPFDNKIIFAAILYAVAFATVLNYEVLSWANSHTAASTVMSFSAIQPIGASILSMLILHSKVYWPQAVGGLAIVLIVLGAFITKSSGRLAG